MVKKQEPAEEETMEACITRVMSANEELTEEQARALCEQQRRAKPEAEPTEAKGFIDKLTAVFEESMDAKMNALMKRIDERMIEVAKQKEDEAVEALRKGLGLHKDPVVHLSEIEGMVRKILLDEKPHGKRTETLTKDKPTEGATETPKIAKADDIFKKLIEKRGANF